MDEPVAISLRTIAVYVAAIVLVRLGSRRLQNKASPFDFVVAIMLGSILSRAITRPDAFWSTLLAGATLLGSHWFSAVLAYHTKWFGPLAKGGRILVIDDGALQENGMRQASLTEKDLKQALHVQAQHTDFSRVKKAYVERSGDISFILTEKRTHIVDVTVEKGVQTVRIEFER